MIARMLPPRARVRWLALSALSVLVVAALPGASATGASGAVRAAELGAFGAPFREPGPVCEDHQSDDPEESGPKCHPTAVSQVLLPTGRVLFWDGLEGSERTQVNIVFEAGEAQGNDQSRVLDLTGAKPVFTTPSPAIAGDPNGGYPPEYLVPDAPPPLDAVLNSPGGGDVALFCANQVLLANGDVLAPGGTDWYSEPHVPGTRYGLSELQGIRNTRIYHTATGRWTQAGPMQWPRWYPSLITLPDGKVFVAGGVIKLLKPMYPNRPPAESGTNVKQTETYDPATGKWTYNGPTADRTLPLYARMHLLPDGKIFYDPGGQDFNPMGQGYDEALWNISAVYDPKTKAWTQGPVPGIGTTAPGMRGSTSSVMLPLKPPYTRAQFLTAGGVLGTPPGGYFAIADSRIATVDTANGDSVTFEETGPLNHARWFSSSVLLPTGQVMAFSGTTADEVLGPGTSMPVREAELFDPATGEWTTMATASEVRAYHNSAMLLPDGRVLVGGHAPIPTLYTSHQTLPGGFTDNHRNTTFEIYSPPYLFWGSRPVIGSAPRGMRYGRTFTIRVPNAGKIANVVLARNTATTHVIDGDQRSLELRIVGRTATSLTLAAPPNGAVAPPGPYLLFVNATNAKGLIPSVARQVFIRA
jgi:hypothetical protein